jgi:hypothetical protein
MALRGEREESIDERVSARVAAIRIAELINVMIGANTKR